MANQQAVLPAKADTQYESFDVPMEEILSDEDFNCRGKIAPIDVVELAQDIKINKLSQPITVQPFSDPARPKFKWRIVAGHRRFAAFKVNKSTHIPAMIRRDLDEMAARLLNLTENLKREDLNILQEARAIDAFVKKGWQEETIAARTGTSRGWVQVRKMVLKLPPDIQAEAAAGILTQEHVRRLYSMPSDEKRYEAVRLIKERRERGESAKLERKKPVRPTEKRDRSKSEMSELQDYIQEQVGNNMITRLLGWATGYVSSIELHRELKEYFLRHEGENYNIPKEVTDALFGDQVQPPT
jgi:ParB/RepB/Spo0J family partition protein